MTTKLDAETLNNIKRLKKTILQKIQRTIRALQKVLANKSNQKNCRLCLRDGNIGIFSGYKGRDIARDIEYALGIQVREDDSRPQHICSSCLDVLGQAVELNTMAEVSQWRLQMEADLVNEADTEVIEEMELDSEPKKQQNGGRKCKKKCCNARLKDHIASPHSSDRTYSCTICGRTFAISRTLMAHERLVHGRPSKR